MKHALIYSFKVWITTAIIAPIIYYVGSVLFVQVPLAVKVFADLCYFVPAATFIGLILSLPCWLAFYLFAQYLNYRRVKPLRVKLWLMLAGTVLSILPFVLLVVAKLFTIFFNLWLDMLISLPYLLVVLLSIHYYKLDAESSAGSDTPTPSTTSQ